MIRLPIAKHCKRIIDAVSLSGISHERKSFMATATLTYDAKVDAKKRVTLRGAKFEYYNVQEMDDGSVILSPRVLVAPFEISQNTLDSMDQSVKNFKAGNVSKPLKL